MDIMLNQRFQVADKLKEYLIFGICLICLFLFLFAGYGKIVDHQTFTKGLSKVNFIGTYAVFIAWMVPLMEIGIATLLIIPFTQKIGLYLFTGTMIVFTLYIGSMLLWNEKLPCHCNLFVEKLSWVEHLWFNLAFIGLSSTAILLGRPNLNLKTNKNEQL